MVIKSAQKKINKAKILFAQNVINKRLNKLCEGINSEIQIFSYTIEATWPSLLSSDLRFLYAIATSE